MAAADSQLPRTKDPVKGVSKNWPKKPESEITGDPGPGAKVLLIKTPKHKREMFSIQ